MILRRRPRPRRTYRRPRASVLYVLRRTGLRLLDLQVWDVAGAMTFFATLSLLPTVVALVSLVSLFGVEEATVEAASTLVAEIWPALDAGQVADWTLRLGQTAPGTLGLVLGLLGAVFSASGTVSAFHRAMHRIHDTREGRSFPVFRAVVFLETLALMLGAVLVLLLIILGGDLSARIGRAIGLPLPLVEVWNIAKWPIILVIIVLTVSAAYHLGPNVRKPRYRPVSAGAVLVVLLLFGVTLLLGWISSVFGELELIGRLNSAIGALALVWVACMVLVAGAALDAEVLRARQLSVGVDAADVLQLASRHTRMLAAAAAAERTNHRVGQLVSDAAASGEPVVAPRTALLTESRSLWAVEPRRPRTAADLTSGRPFHVPDDDAGPGTD